jgi:hypothetical protein
MFDLRFTVNAPTFFPPRHGGGSNAPTTFHFGVQSKPGKMPVKNTRGRPKKFRSADG